MTDLAQKARQGRLAALNTLHHGDGLEGGLFLGGARFRAAASHEKVIFLSRRSGLRAGSGRV